MLNNYIDLEQLNINIEKINLYLREEKKIFGEFEINFNSLKEFYRTDNTILLENCTEEIKNKMKKIKDIHENDVTIINKNLSHYIKVSEKTVEKIL